MNLNVFIPPLISLAIVAVWLIPDWKRGEPAANANSSGEVESPDKERSRKEKTSVVEQRAFDPESASWLAMGSELGRMSGSRRTKAEKAILLACRARIRAMSSEDVLAALEESDGPDFEGKTKTSLQNEFFHDLIEKDPGLLLGYYRRHFEPGKPFSNGFLRKALASYAGRSPEEAIAWLDGVIAEGVFDNSGTARHSRAWLDCEQALVEGLMVGRIELAERRIEGVPEDARDDLAPNALFLSEMPLATQAAQIHLWQKFLEKQQMREFLTYLSAEAVSKGGLENVTALLDQAKVTAQGRAAVASSVAGAELARVAKSREPGPQDVENIRRWAAAQGSRELGKITGQAITYLANREAFGADRAFELILSYHEKTKSDAMLAAFLENPLVWNDRERAQELASRIKDPKLHKKATRKR